MFQYKCPKRQSNVQNAFGENYPNTIRLDHVECDKWHYKTYKKSLSLSVSSTVLHITIDALHYVML